MNLNKLIHGPNVAGQSLVDRVIAAKHSLAGQGLAKSVCKATTEELMPPKKKHIDSSAVSHLEIPQRFYLEWTVDHVVQSKFPSELGGAPNTCDHTPVSSVGTQCGVVFLELEAFRPHTMRFLQYIASNNCSFTLENYMDRSTPQGYDMSPWVRRYARYLNAKAYSYRLMAYDFCKIKKGKEDGILRVIEAEKLLKALPVLQVQVEALLEFDVTRTNLTNAVINASFMMLFKDLIRLLACYNDAIINLLAKYFEMSRKQCKEALDMYKSFVERMELVAKFLCVAESVGIDRGDIPDLAKAPSSLLDALETHLKSLEKSRRDSRAGVVISDAISNLTAAQLSISGSENQRVLTFAESSVLASNNPFADLLSSSDATPDSGAGDDLVVAGTAKNPFLLPGLDEDDKTENDELVAAAVIATHTDPWSVNGSAGNKTMVTGFATEEQFAAAFGVSSTGGTDFAADFSPDARSNPAHSTPNPVEQPAANKNPVVNESVVPNTAQVVAPDATSPAAKCNVNDNTTNGEVQEQLSSPAKTTNEPVEHNMSVVGVTTNGESTVADEHETSVVGYTTNGHSSETCVGVAIIKKSPLDEKTGAEMSSEVVEERCQLAAGHNVTIVVEPPESSADDQNDTHLDAASDATAKAVIESVEPAVAEDGNNDDDDDDDSYLDLR